MPLVGNNTFIHSGSTPCHNAPSTGWDTWGQRFIEHFNDDADFAESLHADYAVDYTGQNLAVPIADNAPNGPNQNRVGWVFRFLNHDANVTSPLTFRLDLGSGSNTNYPAIALTIGSEHDALGTLKHQSPTVRFATTANGNFLNYAIRTGADGFCMAYWTSTPNTSMLIGVERTRDINGNPTNDGAIVSGYSNATGFQSFLWRPDERLANTNYAFTPVAPRLNILGPAQGTGVIDANTTAVYPIYPSMSGPYTNPGLNWLAYFDGDFTPGTPVTIPLYGQSISYLPLNMNVLGPVSTRPASGMSLMMRWS